MTFLLTLLSRYWPQLLIGLAVALFLGYVEYLRLDNQHLKTKVNELNGIISKINANNKTLADNNQEITRRYTGIIRDYNHLVDINSDNIEKRIQSDKELNNVKLTLNAVRLYNDSTKLPANTKEPTTA